MPAATTTLVSRRAATSASTPWTWAQSNRIGLVEGAEPVGGHEADLVGDVDHGRAHCEPDCISGGHTGRGQTSAPPTVTDTPMRPKATKRSSTCFTSAFQVA
jgi:hypothetical protein